MGGRLVVPPPAHWDYEADLCVVGAGGCGMVAALSAAERGAQVLLLDRDRRGQCNTARSGGMIPAGGTRFQREAGVEDSPEQLAREILEKNHGQGPRELILPLSQRAPEMVNEHAQVLCPDGRRIPGLYAGGGAAAGISGHGADGYLSGNGLLTALGLGRIAGLHAATRIERR